MEKGDGMDDELNHHTIIFRKSSEEAVAVTLTEWNGEPRVDVRIYVQAIGGDDLIPTKRGVSIPVDLFPSMLDAVRKLGNVMARERLVGRIPRGKDNEIRVGANEFKGRRLLYIRLFRNLSKAGEETWQPTRKGVSMRVDLYPRLLDALEEIKSALDGG